MQADLDARWTNLHFPLYASVILTSAGVAELVQRPDAEQVNSCPSLSAHDSSVSTAHTLAFRRRFERGSPDHGTAWLDAQVP